MTTERYNRAAQMLYHACEFSESADLLLMKDHRRNRGICQRYFNSALVCLSLSCEIYIKTLLVYYGVIFNKIHTLNKLFNTLPVTLKDNIRSSSGVDENLIKEFSDTFTTRRYFYENNESITYMNIGKLQTLRDVLRSESCKAVHSMTWDEYREKMGW